MRNQFDEQLELLNVELIKMGALCEEAIGLATRALLEGSAASAEKAVAVDAEIDQKEREIEQLLSSCCSNSSLWHATSA